MTEQWKAHDRVCASPSTVEEREAFLRENITVAAPRDWDGNRRLKQATHERQELHEKIAIEALDLVAELWPKPGSATVHLESHQWNRVRRVLLAVPELGEPL